MRDAQTPSEGPVLPDHGRGVGHVHRSDRRPVAADADQLSNNARARVFTALALRTRYRSQTWIAVAGVTGAAILFAAWVIQSGAVQPAGG